MKFVFLTGGATGFAVAAFTSVWAGRGSDRILFNGAVGCLVGALLFRWCWSVLLRGIREVYLARQSAAKPVSAPVPTNLK